MKLLNRWEIWLTISQDDKVLRKERISSGPFKWLEELTLNQVKSNMWYLELTSGFKLDYAVRRAED
jgi:hypothetical protein